MTQENRNRNESATVMVADDDPQVREALGGILRRAGYHVVEAIDGKAAIRVVAASEVHVALCDLAMPELDGIELITLLHETQPDLKIIAMSGFFDASVLRAARYLGASLSLEKPLSAQGLLMAVEALLRAP